MRMSRCLPLWFAARSTPRSCSQRSPGRSGHGRAARATGEPRLGLSATGDGIEPVNKFANPLLRIGRLGRETQSEPKVGNSGFN